VQVTADTYAPVVSLAVPHKPADASSWRVVAGTVSDKGLGAAQVRVTLIQERSGKWHFYDGAKWVKASSQADAAARAKVLTDTPLPLFGVWGIGVNGVGKGTLKVSYTAVDRAGNTASTQTYTTKITK
jgi:5'-nucleotidase